MPFSFVNYGQKILQEIIRFFERSAGLTKGSQILTLKLFQLLGITHKQPDRSIRRIFLDALWIDRGSHLSLLECFQIAVDAPVRSCVALILDLSPKNQAVVFSLLPAFEDVGCKWVKGTLLLPSFLRFGKGSLLEASLRTVRSPQPRRFAISFVASLLASSVPQPADTVHIDLHVVLNALSRHRLAQVDAILRWR